MIPILKLHVFNFENAENLTGLKDLSGFSRDQVLAAVRFQPRIKKPLQFIKIEGATE